MSSASRVIFRPVLHRGPDSAGIGVLSHNPMLRSHRGGEFQAKWRRRKSYGLLELAEPIPKGLAANDMTNLEKKSAGEPAKNQTRNHTKDGAEGAGKNHA